MCEIMEELIRDATEKAVVEAEKKANIQTALKMLAKDVFSLDIITQISGLTPEEVQALADGKSI